MGSSSSVVASALSEVRHLVRRFGGSLSNRPPDERDVEWAMNALSETEQMMWRKLGNIDQRHTIEVARRACVLCPSLDDGKHRAVLAGVLLHDIGKVEANLGTISRVVATILGRVMVTRSRRGDGRISAYLRHESIGATMVAEAGSDPLTVGLVARDSTIPKEWLDLLVAADDV